MKKITKRLDYLLLGAVALFLILGLSFLSTISAPISLKNFGTANYYLMHQIKWGVLPGLILGLIAFLLPVSFIKKSAPFLILGVLISLILVFIPFLGDRFLGASRWLNLRLISFQPSEFLKIILILYLSSWLSKRIGYGGRGAAMMKEKKPHCGVKKIFIPFIGFLATISLILVFQPDISTLGIIGLISLAIFFSARTPLWQNLVVVAGAITGLFFLIKFESYRLSRWIVFLNPETDPMGVGFQMKQALIALGSGGLGGRGFGISSQVGFLPQTMSDSIFAVYGEETGFAGCVALVLFFLLFLWVGLMISNRAKDMFSRLTAVGITFWIVLQGFVNISSIIGLMPLTGLPLPFMSNGGSHLLSELIGMGILLKIARQSNK